MKTAIKRENDDFLVISLKHVRVLMRQENPPGTRILWGITHENGHKHENDEFSDITHKHVTGLQVVVNRPVTPKLWAIAHEKGNKTQKQRVYGHYCQTCKGSYEACKSAWNPKTAGNNS